MPLSHSQPPKKWAETITTGTLTAMRGSTAASRKVWVPPPDSPVIPIRVGSTSGSDSRKSTARIAFQSWSFRVTSVLWARCVASP